MARRGNRVDDTVDAQEEKQDDERPRRRRGSSEDEAPAKKSRSPQGGWGEFDKARKGIQSNAFPEFWKPVEEETLVKFLDDAPFASYGLHWFDEIRKGRKGFECLATQPDPEPCPACDLLSDNARLQVLFNLVVFDEETGDAEVRVLRCGVTLANQLKSLAESRNGPLTKHYWDISASGSGGSYSANCNVVKERDLTEDWDLKPLTEDEIESFNAERYDAGLIKFPTKAELKRVVEDLLD